MREPALQRVFAQEGNDSLAFRIRRAEVRVGALR